MIDPVSVVGEEPTEPVDWSELWAKGEMVHHSTGSICPFLGPVQLRAFETDAQRRNTDKYVLARATPFDGRPSSSLFILAVPKPKHVHHFVAASKGVWGGTPGRRLLGSIGLLHANRTRFGWRVEFVQAHYNNTSAFPLKRSVATQYAGWANRAMQLLAKLVCNDAAWLAFYGVTWVERERHSEHEASHTERVMVPQNTLSLSHFTSAFRSRGYHVVHLGGSTRFRLGHRSVLVAFRWTRSG